MCLKYFINLDELAKFAQNAEKKRPELRNKREKLAILGKPRAGDLARAQIRIKESKEFKVCFLKSPFSYLMHYGCVLEYC